MKTILTIILFCITTSVLAQSDTINWKGYFSYNKVQQIVRGQNNLIVAAENSFFTYNTTTNLTTTISTVQGLSGDEISTIYQTQDGNLIFIGYKNGLIQIYNTTTNNIKFVVDILEKQTVSPDQKQINQFFVEEGIAYIATDFGIATYNINQLEFGDTFFIGNAGQELIVNQVTVQNDIIYAATIGGGIRYASLDNPNLIDFNEWQAINSFNYKFIQNINGKVFVIQLNNQLIKIEDDFSITSVSTIGFNVRAMRSNENSIFIVGKEQVVNFDINGQSSTVFDGFQDAASNFQDALIVDNELFLGDEKLGLVKVDIPDSPEFLSPNGPLQNRMFNIAVNQNEIWAVYGEYSVFYNPFPLNRRGISHFKNGKWINQTTDDIDNLAELSHINIDPQNPDRTYISSYYDGILVIEDDSLVQNYNVTNSAIENALGNDANGKRIGSSVFVGDELFFTNGLTENPLKSLNREGDFQVYDTSDGLNNPLETAIAKVVASPSGNLYFSTIREGVIAYNPNTNESEAATSADTGVDFPEVFAANPNITALRFDNNGNLWIGTNRGIRVFFNPSAVFDPEARLNISPIIFDDNGTPQELLFEQTITDIQVDGANNKWIATSSSGVFQVSPNGQETLNRFTKDNSPLPSDQVISIDINGEDGRVFFATTKGLVSFQTRVTNASDDLSNIKIFPNPVKPDFNGLVTIEGLTDDANVKITDITGNLVFEDESKGGSIQWNTKAFGKHQVASGVYLVLITGADQMETQLEKIMVIR